MATASGRVARVDLGVCTVLTEGGTVRVSFGPNTDVAVGDVVTYVPGDPHRLAEVEERRSAFVRAATGQETKQQVVAANVDTVLLVNALDAPVNLRRIERALALSWQSGASPAIVLTKSDLADERTRSKAEAGVHTVALGVPVHVVSATTGEGIEDLRAAYLQPGETVALLGQSGAGKSTLVNSLAGAEVMATGEVRRDGKGRHTTTHRELIPLESGAFLIDTPGMRSLALWDAGDGIERAFADVEELASTCRFNDCAHDTEPGCAVQAAIADGAVAAARVDAWRKLHRELHHLAVRQDQQLKMAEERKWKAVTKRMRNLPPKR